MLVESPVAICSSLIENNMLHRDGLAICVFWRITERTVVIIIMPFKPIIYICLNRIM